MSRPIVIVPACSRMIGAHPSYAVQNKYVAAVLNGADCMPLMLPAFAQDTDWETVLGIADGIFLTGSPSNVHPDHFGEAVHDPELPLDPARDGTTLPLIRAAMKHGIPLFAVCRGFQEVNVALGGTLLQAVHEVDGKMDHRENKDLSLDDQYGVSHPVQLTPGGWLARLLAPEVQAARLANPGMAGDIMVNSLHGQGVARLADGLQIEASAPDGLVEAFSLPALHGFSLAVQWHPEWKLADNPVSVKLFAAFGAACRRYHDSKTGVLHESKI